MSEEAGSGRSGVLKMFGAVSLVVVAGAGGWLLRDVTGGPPSGSGVSSKVSVGNPVAPSPRDCGLLPEPGGYLWAGDAPAPPAEEGVRRLLAELTSDDVKRRWKAAKELGSVGPEAEPARAALNALRNDEEPGVDERFPEWTVGAEAREALAELDRWAGIVAYRSSFDSVRDVPWQDWSLPTMWEPITTFEDGAWTWEEGDDPSEYGVTLEQVMYGDLTGDGPEEAVLAVLYRSLRVREDELHVYGIDRGQLRQLGRIFPGGSSTHGRIRNVVVEQGRIALDQDWFSPGDPRCCPSQVRHVEWVWKCGRLVMDEEATYLAPKADS